MSVFSKVRTLGPRVHKACHSEKSSVDKKGRHIAPVQELKSLTPKAKKEVQRPLPLYK